jgi:hypothetical protein
MAIAIARQNFAVTSLVDGVCVGGIVVGAIVVGAIVRRSWELVGRALLARRALLGEESVVDWIHRIRGALESKKSN